MARTPEGRVKEQVKQLLHEFKVYYYMPVPVGYGMPGLDFHCSYKGRAFFIETKAPKQQLTPRQQLTKKVMEDSESPVFIISGEQELDELRQWLCKTLLIESARKIERS